MNKTTLIDWQDGKNGIRLEHRYNDANTLLITTNGWQWTGGPVNKIIINKLIDELTRIRDSGELGKCAT